MKPLAITMRNWVRPSINVATTVVFTGLGALIFWNAAIQLNNYSLSKYMLVFTILTILFCYEVVQIDANSSVTVTSGLFIAGILVFGTANAIWAATVEMVLQGWMFRASWYLITRNIGILLTDIYVTSYVHNFLSSYVYWYVNDIFAIVVFFLMNCLIFAFLHSMKLQQPYWTILFETLRNNVWSYLLVLGYGAVAARMIEQWGFGAFVLLTVLYLVLLQIFRQHYRDLAQINQAMADIKKLNDAFLRAMSAAIDARDPYTYGHSNRVAFWAREIAKAHGLKPHEVEEIFYGGIVHDIGKIGIEDYILNKESSLSKEEFEKMKMHTVIGAEIVQRAGVFQNLIPAIRHHHERVDGKGYPDELPSNQIPVMAKILAVADAFDAMVSDRPYRKGLSIEEAKRRLIDGIGYQFEEQYVKSFMKALEQFTPEVVEQLTKVSQPDQALLEMEAASAKL